MRLNKIRLGLSQKSKTELLLYDFVLTFKTLFENTPYCVFYGQNQTREPTGVKVKAF